MLIYKPFDQNKYFLVQEGGKGVVEKTRDIGSSTYWVDRFQAVIVGK